MSNKKKILTICISILTGLAFAGLVVLCTFYLNFGKVTCNNPKMVYFGDVSLDNYKIIAHNPFSENKAVDELQDLIEAKTGVKLSNRLRGGSYPYTIMLITDKDYTGEKMIVSGGKIILYGEDSKDLVKTVRSFANMYLGWSFAGEAGAHILSDEEIHNPDTTYVSATPWIEEREPIICLWKTNVPRGQFYNTGASLKSEILTYSDDQLYNYVKAMKACGFTGIQVTDMCSAWAQYAGYEFVHDRLRFMANAAHSLDMKFTLWVWGAEFDGYGWEDDTVVYYDYANYQYSFECPEAYATFDKYYSIYAELADCSDRVIVHYDDPSNIHDSLEIATYAKLLKEKFKAINPDINFGVSDYTNKYDKAVMAAELGTDTTIYCGATTYEDKSWRGFREDVLKSGCDLGVWSWNLCEMEIDQLAEMNVNSELIRIVYLQTMVNGDDIMKPSYWSEMDSYHGVNIFSLYCAGHLLQNPAEEAEGLLREISTLVVGEEYAEDLYQILTIIEDARTGDRFAEFKWSSDDDGTYLLTSDAYPAEDILSRCNIYCDKLDEMIAADIKNSSIPMSMSVSDLLSLIRSHLKQIQLFAEFRVSLAELETDLAQGESKENLYKKLESISTPIPNYDVLVGVWGQPESLAQFKLIAEFAKKADIEMPENAVYKYYLKQYVYQEICAYQKKKNDCNYYSYTDPIWVAVIGEEAFANVLDSLIDDGLLIKKDSNSVYLTNWEDYVFAY